MSDHGTDHGTFLACTPTTRSQRSRHAETYAQNNDHGTDHADHAPSDHALPPLFIGGSVSGDLGRPQNFKETTMSTTTTATIETLTAEVRTLVLGSRQITLSVAKQLDIVDLSQLRIFGRIKVNITKYKHYVIGADRDGQLALAQYWPLGNYFGTYDVRPNPDALRAWDALNKAAVESPLIVLAGLK
jgi:hypothetical protein